MKKKLKIKKKYQKGGKLNWLEKAEDRLQQPYVDQSWDFAQKSFPNFGDDEGHNDWRDALRHTGTAMYMTSGQGENVSPLMIPYTNIMGLVHEAKGLSNYMNKPRKTWKDTKQQFKETGSDIYNNFFGSVIGGLPINIKEKEKLLLNATKNKQLSILQTNEDIQRESLANLRNWEKSKMRIMPGESQQLFAEFADGGKTNKPIFTSNPKDPRIQAYKDSLDIYNFGDESVNVVKNATKYFDGELPLNIRQAADRLYDLNGDFPQQKDVIKKEWKFKDGHKESLTAGHFTKPVQPIVYKPEEKKQPLYDYQWQDEKGDIWSKKPGSMDYRPQPIQRPKEQPINIQSAKPDLLQGNNQQLEFNPIPFTKGSYFTRPRQSQEIGDDLEFFDKKTGRKLEFGGQNELDMKKNGGKIQIKKSHKGLLHRDLGIPEGQKIPKSKLKIKSTDSPAVKKRKIFAQNFAKETGGYLPMAEDGYWNGMYSQGFNPNVSQFTPPQELQPLNVQMPDYQLEQSPFLTPTAPTGQENLTQVKDLVPFDNKKPKVNLKQFGIQPITGNKYFNRGITYMNQAIKHGMNINSQNPNMSPDYNGLSGYMANGGLMRYADNGLVLNQGQEQHYPWDNNITGLPPQSTQFQGNNTSFNQIDPASVNVDTPQNQGQGGNKFNNIMQGVAAGVNATQGLINFGKGTLDILGSQRQNNMVQNMQNQLYTQSVFSQNMDNRPEDYIYNRNALAENGIEMKGIPNIEVEHKEVVIKPNGYSKRVVGKTHAEGGIPLSLEMGSKVGSEKLAVSAKELTQLKDYMLPKAEDGIEVKELSKVPGEFSFLNFIKIPEKGKLSMADMMKPFETKKNFEMLEDKNADDIQALTAQLMIQEKDKNQQQVFALQENLKGSGYFGKKIQKEAQNEQFMKNGGIKKAANGDWTGQTFATKEGRITPTGVDLNKNPLLNWQAYKDQWEKLAGHKFSKTSDLQEFAYDWALDNNPQLLKDTWRTFGVTNKNEKNYQGKDVTNLSTQDLKDLRGNFIDNLRGKRMFSPQNATVPPVITKPVVENPLVPGKETIQFKDRYIQTGRPDLNINGLNIGIPLPNVYSREPLNYYKTNPNYIDPRYLNVQSEQNQINRGVRAIQNNLGSRGTSDVSNLLQAQTNAYNQNEQLYQNKYNYDRNQDISSQTYNATAKTNSDQYNQQSWYNQLENPIRMRESAIGDQELTDYYRGQERFDQANAYNTTNNFIDKRFGQYQNMPWNDAINNVFNNGMQGYGINPNDDISTIEYRDSKGNLVKTVNREKKKYGGKVKISPKIKKK